MACKCHGLERHEYPANRKKAVGRIYKWRLGTEAESRRISGTKTARKREYQRLEPSERVAKAKKAINLRWERLRARFGGNPKPYLPLNSVKKEEIVLLNCEICLHEERRDRIRTKFSRWTEYQEHMRQIHHLEVTKDGLHTQSSEPRPLPPADEL